MHQWSAVQGLIHARPEYDRLVLTYVPAAIGAFTLIVLVAFTAVVIRRLRPSERVPARWRERDPLRGSYAVLLVCVAALLLYLAFTDQRNVDTVSDQHHPSVVIKVLASPANSSASPVNPSASPANPSASPANPSRTAKPPASAADGARNPVSVANHDAHELRAIDLLGGQFVGKVRDMSPEFLR